MTNFLTDQGWLSIALGVSLPLALAALTVSVVGPYRSRASILVALTGFSLFFYALGSMGDAGYDAIQPSAHEHPAVVAALEATYDVSISEYDLTGKPALWRIDDRFALCHVTEVSAVAPRLICAGVSDRFSEFKK